MYPRKAHDKKENQHKARSPSTFPATGAVTEGEKGARVLARMSSKVSRTTEPRTPPGAPAEERRGEQQFWDLPNDVQREVTGYLSDTAAIGNATVSRHWQRVVSGPRLHECWKATRSGRDCTRAPYPFLCVQYCRARCEKWWAGLMRDALRADAVAVLLALPDGAAVWLTLPLRKGPAFSLHRLATTTQRSSTIRVPFEVAATEAKARGNARRIQSDGRAFCSEMAETLGNADAEFRFEDELRDAAAGRAALLPYLERGHVIAGMHLVASDGTRVLGLDRMDLRLLPSVEAPKTVRATLRV